MRSAKWTLFVNGVLAVVALVGVVSLPACRTEKKGQVSVTEKNIQTVMENHAKELMAINGVTAVAIGALEDGTPCIKVYVVESTQEIRRRIPKKLEGHPVVVEVSGEIRPLNGG